MITGHNTEVKHDNVAFHVQTEDKGVSDPYIVSLIYVGGRVLAARRTSYAEKLAEGLEEPGIAELIERQHRTMVVAIRHGRFDDELKELLDTEEPAEAAPVEQGSGGDETLEDLGTSLNQMVSQYLGTEVPKVLEVAVQTFSPRPNTTAMQIEVRAYSSPGGAALEDVGVLVELICMVRPPEMLATGSTGGDGAVLFSIPMPEVEEGMAALIVRAAGELGEAEETILI